MLFRSRRRKTTPACSTSNLPERQQAILQGETLLNDASGIVSFQFAIAAAVTGSFSAASAVGEFAVEFFGGLVVGTLLGYLVNFCVRKIRDLGLENTTFHVLLEVFLPFIVFLIYDWDMGVRCRIR